jgi:hypothetical protein
MKQLNNSRNQQNIVELRNSKFTDLKNKSKSYGPIDEPYEQSSQLWNKKITNNQILKFEIVDCRWNPRTKAPQNQSSKLKTSPIPDGHLHKIRCPLHTLPLKPLLCKTMISSLFTLWQSSVLNFHHLLLIWDFVNSINICDECCFQRWHIWVSKIEDYWSKLFGIHHQGWGPWLHYWIIG